MEILSKDITIKKSVIPTLAFFDILNVSLTRSQISDYILLNNKDEKKIDLYLKDSPLIQYKNGFFSLKDNNYESKIDIINQYWRKVRKYQFIFNICPFIKCAFVCNSLAMNSISENSDIDVLIISNKNKLFTARFFLTILTSLFGVRRYANKIHKRFCLSFYCDESSLKISEIALKPYDIYLAFWFKTLQPISGTYDIYEKIIDENKEFLIKYFKSKSSLNRRYYKKRNKLELIIKNCMEKLFSSKHIESVFKQYQLKRAQKKYELLDDKTGTIISDKMLKFHDKDARKNINLEWEKRIEGVFTS